MPTKKLLLPLGLLFSLPAMAAPSAISTDFTGDLGYSSTIELEPGRFLSLWYDSKDQEQT